jgi:hypothetical protein
VGRMGLRDAASSARSASARRFVMSGPSP